MRSLRAKVHAQHTRHDVKAKATTTAARFRASVDPAARQQKRLRCDRKRRVPVCVRLRVQKVTGQRYIRKVYYPVIYRPAKILVELAVKPPLSTQRLIPVSKTRMFITSTKHLVKLNSTSILAGR